MRSINDVPAHYEMLGKDGLCVTAETSTGRVVSMALVAPCTMDKVGTYMSGYLEAFWDLERSGLIAMTTRRAVELMVPVVVVNSNYTYPTVVRKWIQDGVIPIKDKRDNLCTIMMRELTENCGGFNRGNGCFKRTQPQSGKAYTGEWVRKALKSIMKVVKGSRTMQQARGGPFTFDTCRKKLETYHAQLSKTLRKDVMFAGGLGVQELIHLLVLTNLIPEPQLLRIANMHNSSPLVSKKGPLHEHKGWCPTTLVHSPT